MALTYATLTTYSNMQLYNKETKELYNYLKLLSIKILILIEILSSLRYPIIFCYCFSEAEKEQYSSMNLSLFSHFSVVITGQRCQSEVMIKVKT